MVVRPAVAAGQQVGTKEVDQLLRDARLAAACRGAQKQSDDVATRYCAGTPYSAVSCVVWAAPGRAWTGEQSTYMRQSGGRKCATCSWRVLNIAKLVNGHSPK